MLVNSLFWRSLIISYLWLTDVTCSECQISQHISFLGPNFPGVRGLILALMSNMCYFAAILIFLLVTARYLVVAARYCSLPGSYCSLLVVTARYRLLLLAPTFSMNVFTYCRTFISSLIFIKGEFLYKVIRAIQEL